MGCEDNPIINYENSYSMCSMTINNLTDELTFDFLNIYLIG